MSALIGLLSGVFLIGLADALLYVTQKRWLREQPVSPLIGVASLALAAAGIFLFAGGTKELPIWGAMLAWVAFLILVALLFLHRRRRLSRHLPDDAALPPT